MIYNFSAHWTSDLSGGPTLTFDFTWQRCMELQQGLPVTRLAAWHQFLPASPFLIGPKQVFFVQLQYVWEKKITDCFELPVKIHENWLQCCDERPPWPSQTLGSTCDFEVESIAAWTGQSEANVQTTWGTAELIELSKKLFIPSAAATCLSSKELPTL